jgi:hypothetical protein
MVCGDSFEEDEKGTIQLVVGNPTPVAFQAIEETIVFIMKI